MAKDNTTTYAIVGLGLVGLYLFMKNKQTILPAGTVTVGPVAPLPLAAQTGLLTSFFQKLIPSLAPASQPVALPPDSSFTSIPNAPPSSADNSQVLSVTSAEGVTALSTGGTFDPNADITTSDLYTPAGGLTTTLTAPTPANTEDITDQLNAIDDDDYSGE
jgi:hypothetical protein